jgi:hypothetical protein
MNFDVFMDKEFTKAIQKEIYKEIDDLFFMNMIKGDCKQMDSKNNDAAKNSTNFMQTTNLQPVSWTITTTNNIKNLAKESFDYKKMCKPTYVIYSDNVTTCFFEDGSKESVKCNEDYFSKSVGVALCILNHVYGNKTNFLRQTKRKSKVYKEFQIPNKVYNVADLHDKLGDFLSVLEGMIVDGKEELSSNEIKEIATEIGDLL